uniref:HAT C-terminal dimerisation domain-containing protein n=1 Tax=Amphimedon queenslandica TaxID=400682 RepID=A0A1X7UVG6_AMPQE
MNGELWRTLFSCFVHLKLQQSIFDSVAIKEVKKVLRDDIKSSCQNPNVRLLFDKASFLDPRFKSLSHLPSVQQSEVIDSVKQELLVMLHRPVNDSSDPGDEQSGLEDDCFNDKVGATEPPNKKAKNALIDILGDSFMLLNHLTRKPKMLLLIYWEIRSLNRQCKTPLPLKHLAQKYLCDVATSVPSEQVFSTAGNVFSSKRSSLLPENVHSSNQQAF